MHSPMIPRSFGIIFGKLTEVQVNQLVGLFENRHRLISTHISLVPNKEAKTVDYTFTCYIASKPYLTRAQIQTLEELNLKRAVCTIFTDCGLRDVAKHEWCATHQTTLSEWLGIVGLWTKESLLKSSHH